MEEITNLAKCNDVLRQRSAILFKHSYACDLSSEAYQVMSRFVSVNKDANVYLISVLDYPEIARYVSEKTEIRHESPQVLAMRNGEVLAHASHRRITAGFLENLNIAGSEDN